MDFTKTKSAQMLKNHYEQIKSIILKQLFQDNKNRFQEFSIDAPEIFLDYSKTHVTNETRDLFASLADEMHLRSAIEAMYSGQLINTTEKRAVLHTALRDPNATPEIRRVLNQMRKFSTAVRDGSWLGFTGKPITDIVNIGIGGSDLGPKMVCRALAPHYGHQRLHGYFISNIDESQLVETLKPLNPETTLFIIASKTFTTQETLTNAESAKKWLLESLADPRAIAKHFVAVSTNAERVGAFGIDPNNMFEFWDWVGGRYSVWSAIGLPIAVLLGMDHFEAFLAGANAIDRHFLNTDCTKNAPMMLALIGFWYRNFFGSSSYAVIPYDNYLQYFTSYLQQMDMESNGKSVTKEGIKVSYSTGPVIWGGIGTDSQHSFHQLLHQGTDLIPIDFIIAINSLNPIGKHHEMLYANCLAQSQALLLGKTKEKAYKELRDKGLSHEEAERLAPHKEMPGNKPSNTILINKLTPKSLGALIALYEHKVFVQGILWGINSFDQWGVELGKQLASFIVPALSDTKENKLFDSSTKGLINYFKNHFNS